MFGRILKQCDPQGAAGLATSQLSEGAIDDAIKTCRDALRWRPHNAECHRVLAVAYEKQGRYEEAVCEYLCALRSWENCADCIALGSALMRLERWDEAVNAFERARTLSPGSIDILVKLAQAYETKGDFKSALKCMNEILALRPRESARTLQLARWYFQVKVFHKSIECCQHILAAEPGHVEALLHLGLCYSELGELAEARDCFVTALERDPDCARAAAELGNILIKQGKHEQALWCVEEAAKKLRRSLPVHRQLALLYRRCGRMADAERALEKILELDHQDGDAWGELGDVRKARGNLAGAFQAYCQAATQKPDDLTVSCLLTEILARTRCDEKAVKLGLELSRKKPFESEPHYAYAFALAHAGRLDEALGEVRWALSLRENYPEAESLKHEIDAAMESGRENPKGRFAADGPPVSVGSEDGGLACLTE